MVLTMIEGNRVRFPHVDDRELHLRRTSVAALTEVRTPAKPRRPLRQATPAEPRTPEEPLPFSCFVDPPPGPSSPFLASPAGIATHAR